MTRLLSLKKIRCRICGREYMGDICSFCGSFGYERAFADTMEKFFDESTGEKKENREFFDENAPNIEYMTYHSKKTKNKNLKRAFNIEYIKKNTGKHKRYLEAYYEIKRIIQFLKFPKIIFDESINLYNIILKKDERFFSRKNKKFVGISACIKLAASYHQVPFNIYNISECTKGCIDTDKGIKKMISNINKTSREIVLLLNFKKNKKPYEAYVRDFCHDLNVPKEVTKELIDITGFLKRYFNSGYKKKGYALGIILYYSTPHGYHIDINEMALKYKINQITIKSREKEIKRLINYIKKNLQNNSPHHKI